MRIGPGSKPEGEEESLVTQVVFGGEHAETANIDRLNEANLMDFNRRPSAETFSGTGWFRGEDQRWRFEIPDTGSRVNRLFLDHYIVPGHHQSFRLDELLVHPELYRAYPHLARMLTIFTPNTEEPNERARYHPRTGIITINTAHHSLRGGVNLTSEEAGRSLHGVILHEIQHAVQDAEGWLMLPDLLREGRLSYFDRSVELEAFETQQRARFRDASGGRPPALARSPHTYRRIRVNRAIRATTGEGDAAGGGPGPNP